MLFYFMYDVTIKKILDKLGVPSRILTTVFQKHDTSNRIIRFREWDHELFSGDLNLHNLRHVLLLSYITH